METTLRFHALRAELCAGERTALLALVATQLTLADEAMVRVAALQRGGGSRRTRSDGLRWKGLPRTPRCRVLWQARRPARRDREQRGPSRERAHARRAACAAARRSAWRAPSGTLTPVRRASASAVMAPSEAVQRAISICSGVGGRSCCLMGSPVCLGDWWILGMDLGLGAGFSGWMAISRATDELGRSTEEKTSTKRAEAPPPSSITAAQPGGRPRISSDASSGCARARARPAPVARVRGPPRSATAAELRDQLGRLGHHLTVGDQRREVAQHLLQQLLAPFQTQVGELLGSQQQVDTGRSGPAEQMHDLLGGDRGELVDHHDRRGSESACSAAIVVCRSCTIATPSICASSGRRLLSGRNRRPLALGQRSADRMSAHRPWQGRATAPRLTRP